MTPCQFRFDLSLLITTASSDVDGDDDDYAPGHHQLENCEEIKVFHLQCGKTMMLTQMLPIISIQRAVSEEMRARAYHIHEHIERVRS